MTDVPAVFDWVTARVQCSIEAVYAALRERVESDIKKMQDVTVGRGVRYEVMKPADDRVIARWSRPVGSGIVDTKGVVFERRDDSIQVREATAQGTTKFVARPYVLPVEPIGRCLLEIEGRGPLELWQVSKLALEDLLFGPLE